MRKSYYPSLLQRIDELQRAKDAAERASRMKTEFLNVASHELRTPLTSLQLLIPLVAQRLDVPELDRMLGRMERQVARLATMVNDMLDVSRLERGAVTIRRAPTDIGELVRDAIETFRLQFPARRISLAAPDRSITVHCDRIRIEQVLDNLLDNAAKYSPDDRPIGVAIAVESSDVRISIRDEGIGIPTEELASLFTPLFRTSRSTALHKSGLGLGLYISAEIVRLHGGRIGVTANPDAGSTFSFYLPAAAPPSAP
jgi:signal transduction histidine kinase